MAIITASVVSVTNSTPQALFTIEQVNGVTSYGTVGDASVINFDTVGTQVGSDISFAAGRNEFTLVGTGNIVYSLQATISATNVDPDTYYGWYDALSGNLIGTTASMGTPVSTVFLNDTGNNVTVTLQITSGSGSFQYPSQVVNASATVTEVSGYSVA